MQDDYNGISTLSVCMPIEALTERKQRRSFQGLKNAVTSIMTKDSNRNCKTAKAVRTVLKRYKTVVAFWLFTGQKD